MVIRRTVYSIFIGFLDWMKQQEVTEGMLNDAFDKADDFKVRIVAGSCDEWSDIGP